MTERPVLVRLDVLAWGKIVTAVAAGIGLADLARTLAVLLVRPW